MQRDDSSPLSILSGNGAPESTGDSPSFNVGILMYIATINQGHWLRPTLYANTRATRYEWDKDGENETDKRVLARSNAWGLNGAHCEILR